MTNYCDAVHVAQQMLYGANKLHDEDEVRAEVAKGHAWALLALAAAIKELADAQAAD